MREREPSMICPEAAVADAMMVAVYKQIDVDLRITKFGEDVEEEFSDLLRKRTSSGCRVGSAHVLMNLSENHKYEFGALLMLETIGSGSWAWHDYFLAKGIDDVWYAGSPANYGREPVERTTNIIKSCCLGEVIELVEEIEGSRWPSEREIMKRITKKDLRIGIEEKDNRKIMKYFCVTRESGRVTGGWCTIKM